MTISISANNLVEDAEALRIHLGIAQWSLIGHSFGGYVGFLYAATYPGAIDRLVFENPTFDLASAGRSLLRHAALEYGVLGNQEYARKCLAIAYDDTLDDRSVWEGFSVLSPGLHAQRDNLYVYGPDKQFFQRLVQESRFGEELWSRGADHQSALYEEGAPFEPLTFQFSRVSHPTLLIRGSHDAVFGLDQLHSYLEAKPDSKLLVAGERPLHPCGTAGPVCNGRRELGGAHGVTIRFWSRLACGTYAHVTSSTKHPIQRSMKFNNLLPPSHLITRRFAERLPVWRQH